MPRMLARAMTSDDLRVHYAFRITRSVEHLGQTVWQPFCGIVDTHRIQMTTELDDVTCLRCRDKLIQQKRKLGFGRQINKILRHGVWYTP